MGKFEENVLTEVLEAAEFLKVEEETLIAVLMQYSYDGFVHDKGGNRLMEEIKLTHPDWEYDVITTAEYLYNKFIGRIFQLDNF